MTVVIRESDVSLERSSSSGDGGRTIADVGWEGSAYKMFRGLEQRTKAILLAPAPS